MPRFAGYRRAEWYLKFRYFMNRNGIQMPRNQEAPGSRRADKVLRFRDRAVIDFAVKGLADTQGTVYQTVRSVFMEGPPAFPGAKIARKSHIQIAVRDLGCLSGYFRPSPGDYQAAA